MVGAVTPLPKRGRAFLDARGDDRSLRVSWRPADGVFVVSIWSGSGCQATFHLAQEALSSFLAGFVDQLTEAAVGAGTSAAH
ncbi:MAG TPA: hypothetical protein VHX15_01715 [Frankiaceae bacterium]|jgi:hypothetical protein|nr:hypothetical protein [Frankiaceae bacterium]